MLADVKKDKPYDDYKATNQTDARAGKLPGFDNDEDDKKDDKKEDKKDKEEKDCPAPITKRKISVRCKCDCPPGAFWQFVITNKVKIFKRTTFLSLWTCTLRALSCVNVSVSITTLDSFPYSVICSATVTLPLLFILSSCSDHEG